MVRTAFSAGVLLAVVSGLSGCMQSPRVVDFNKVGGFGVVAVPSNSNSWPNYNKDEAMKKIEELCQKQKFIIVDQKEYDPQRDQKEQKELALTMSRAYGADLAMMMAKPTGSAEYRYAFRVLPANASGMTAPPGLQRGPNGQLQQVPPPIGGNAQSLGSSITPVGGYGGPGQTDPLLRGISPVSNTPGANVNPNAPIGSPSNSAFSR